MSDRRILIVAYPFPPMPSVGANRWDAMARHLRLLGHEVSVVSTSAFGQMQDGEQERHVSRAGDLTAAPWLRRALGRGPLPPPTDAPAAQTLAAPPESPLPGTLRKIFVPDLYLATWVPQALALALRTVRRERTECVITTSPYESAHLLGPPLQQRGRAWIADFRDGWSFEPHRPDFPTAAQRALDRWMERRLVEGADRVITATRPVAEDFRNRLGVDAIHIANGFDPVHLQPALVTLPPMSDDAVVIVHTGTIAGVSGRDPRGLFAAMRRLRSEEPEAAARLRLVLAGRLDSEDASLVAGSGLDDQIVQMGERPRAESLGLQRRADALVLIASPDGSEATGKLFEYLSAGRPILALAGPEVARIVAATGTGVTVRPDDPDAIMAQLRRLIAGELAREYHPERMEEYIYPGPAKRVAEVIEEAIAASASRR